jgi:hypothetical protein
LSVFDPNREPGSLQIVGIRPHGPELAHRPDAALLDRAAKLLGIVLSGCRHLIAGNQVNGHFGLGLVEPDVVDRELEVELRTREDLEPDGCRVEHALFPLGERAHALSVRGSSRYDGEKEDSESYKRPHRSRAA